MPVRPLEARRGITRPWSRHSKCSQAIGWQKQKPEPQREPVERPEFVVHAGGECALGTVLVAFMAAIGAAMPLTAAMTATESIDIQLPRAEMESLKQAGLCRTD